DQSTEQHHPPFVEHASQLEGLYDFHEPGVQGPERDEDRERFDRVHRPPDDQRPEGDREDSPEHQRPPQPAIRRANHIRSHSSPPAALRRLRDVPPGESRRHIRCGRESPTPTRTPPPPSGPSHSSPGTASGWVAGIGRAAEVPLTYWFGRPRSSTPRAHPQGAAR